MQPDGGLTNPFLNWQYGITHSPQSSQPSLIIAVNTA